jgi:hypothetical protein
MANTAFDHASALTIPGSTTNNGLVRWGDTSGTSFGNITGITSDGSNITLLTRGEIRFSDADSTHFIALESPATVSTSYTMTLPAAVPSAADYLKVTSYSGGAGVLEWASVSTDTNTTYLTSWVDSSTNAILRLTPSSGSADDLTIVAGTNITLTPSGDNLTIDAAAGGIASVVADTTPQLGGNLDMVANLLVGNGGSTGIAISSAGEVTMAAQPSVGTFATAGQSNVTGNGASHTVLQTEIWDINADFASNTFTAPVTGKYMVASQVEWEGGGHNQASLHLVATLRTWNTYSDFGNSSLQMSQSNVKVLDMDAGDTLFSQLMVGGIGANTADINSGSADDVRSGITIHLLG